MADAQIRGPWSWRRELLASSLPATTKHVLLTLSCHVNEAGDYSAFPGPKCLARECSLGVDTVKKHLRDGHDAGWVVKEQRFTDTGRQTTNRYMLSVPAGRGVFDAPLPRNTPPEGGAKHPPHKNSTEEKHTLSSDRESDGLGLEVQTEDPVTRLWEVWLEELGGAGPKPSLETGQRKKKLRALYDEHLKDHEQPLEVFRRILRAVKKSEHHMGNRAFQYPDSLFRNAERRERWALEALSSNGAGTHWSENLK